MLSNLFKLFFAFTAYLPILLIIGLVEIFNIYNNGYKVTWISSFNEIYNRINLIWIFLLIMILCYLFMSFSTRNLTVNKIEVKSIKTADLNISTLIISYFLPCVEIFKKDLVYIIGWLILLTILILINKNTYFYNPIIKIFGYRYYEIATKREVSYLMISKEKLINNNQINSYCQLTDYVILNKN